MDSDVGFVILMGMLMVVPMIIGIQRPCLVRSAITLFENLWRALHVCASA